MAFSVGQIEATIGANMKPFQSAMDKVRQEGIKTANKVGDAFLGAGKKLTAGVTAPIAGLGGLLIKTASDAEETSSKFQTVFKDIASSANNASKELASSFGLSSNASRQLLSDTGDLLTGFGFTQEKALELSTEVNKLAVDLASFTNFSGGAEGASQALTKALLGERESVKSLGISILEADVQAKMLENTQKGLTFETERQAKAFATLKLAQEQSKNAIGDFSRTQDNFANKMRVLKSNINDLAVSMGKMLLPMASKVIDIVDKGVKIFTAFSNQTKKIILALSGLAAAIGPTLLAVGAAVKLLPLLAAGFAALVSPIGLAVAAISGLALGITYIWDNWKAVQERISDIGWWRNAIINMIQFFNDQFLFRIFDGFNAIIKMFGGSGFANPFSVVSKGLEKLKVETGEYKNEFGSFKRAMINGLAEITGFNLSSIFSSSGMGQEDPSIPYKKINTQITDMSHKYREVQSVAIPTLTNIKEKNVALTNALNITNGIANTFTSSFGSGLANVIVEGEKLIKVLENVGKLLLSSAIQKGLSILLTGGLSGSGYFGKKGGLIGGAIRGIGRAFGVSEAAIPTASAQETSMTRAFKQAMDQKFQELTPEAVWVMGEKGRLGV